MVVIEIDGYPLDPLPIRKEALLISSKSWEDNKTKILRVCAILFNLTSRQYAPAAQWKFLPNELVKYLVDNSLIIKKELYDFTYNSWNMFGLPVGWQIIKCCRKESPKGFSILSILIDASCREKNISHFIIDNRGPLIRSISMRYFNDIVTTARICDNYVQGKLTMTLYFSVSNEERGYRTITKWARKIIADGRSQKHFLYEPLDDYYFDSFPKLEENYHSLSGYTESEADVDFNEVRKYFKLFQQLLCG
jgi:hypothetical protein